MKTILILIVALLIGRTLMAAGNPGNPVFNPVFFMRGTIIGKMKRPELILRAEKKENVTYLKEMGKRYKKLTTVEINPELRLTFITPGPMVRHRIAKGQYPECYPARFSLKLFYTIQ